MSDDIRKKSLRELLPKEDFDPVAKRTGSARRKTAPEITLEPRRASTILETYGEDSFEPAGRPGSRKRPSPMWWLLLAIVVITGGYYLSVLLAKATITITPRSSVVKIAGQFEASQAPAAGIEYSVIKLSDSLQKTVPASGQVKVLSKAKGTVTITNNFSASSQKLLAGTRLSSAGGLIFRLDKSITVPGKGKNGSIAVTVTADAAGGNYNIAPGSFKIVGFKGTPKYDGFLASSGKAMSGGASGVTAVVGEDDKNKAVEAAQTELKNRLAGKAQLQIPKDYLMYPDGEMFSYTDTLEAGNGTSSANITVKAQMIALLFNAKNLGQQLAAKQFAGESTDGMAIADPGALEFKLLGREQFDVNKTTTIDFNLTGPATFIWPVDTAGLKGKLAGIKFRNKDAVFSAFPNIYRAVAAVSPFWVMNFPSDPSKIIIKTISPTNH